MKKMAPGPQPVAVHAGLVQLNRNPGAQDFPDSDSPDLASIAARWDGIEHWDAPLRNPMWIERADGRPVAAVSGSFDELVAGMVERRRQAIAHAPDDIRALLRVIQELGGRRGRSGRGSSKVSATSEPQHLTAA